MRSPQEFTRDALWASYNNQPHLNPTTTQRAKDIIKAVLHFSRIPEVYIYQHFAKPYASIGYEVLGHGYHTTTLRDGDRVIKVYRQTVGADEYKLTLQKKVLEAKQSVLLDYFPDEALPQTFEVDCDPKDKNIPALLARQAFIAPDLFLDFRRDQMPPPRAFLDTCTRMEDEMATVLDVYGRHNVSITSGAIQIIDTIPLVKADPADTNAYALSQTLLKLAMQKHRL